MAQQLESLQRFETFAQSIPESTMSTPTANEVYAVSPVAITGNEPQNNLNPSNSMNDSGIGSDSGSPFSSSVQATITSTADEEAGRMGFCNVPPSDEAFQSGNTVIEPGNAIQHAFFLAESSLNEIENVDDASESQILSSSTEGSVDVEKTYMMKMSSHLDSGTEHKDDGRVPHLHQLETLYPNCGMQVANETNLMWLSKPAVQPQGPKSVQLILSTSQAQGIFYPSSQNSPADMVKCENKMLGYSTAQGLGCCGDQNSVPGSLIQQPGGHMSYHNQLPVTSCSEQMPGAKMPTFDPPIIAADPLLQHQEQEVKLKLVQGSIHPIVQAHVLDLLKEYRQRSSQAEQEVLSVCSGPAIGAVVTPCIMRFIKAQRCLTGEFIIALLDVLTQSHPYPVAESKLDINPVSVYSSPSYSMYGYSSHDPPPYQQCMQVPASMVKGHMSRRHVISPTDVSNDESSYSNKVLSSGCPVSNENQCGVYQTHSEPIHIASPEPFVSNFDSSHHQMAHVPKKGVIQSDEQEVSILKCSPGCNSRKLNPEAKDIMNRWYYEHLAHPYPNPETTEHLAKTCHITVDQVKKWFANKRMRSRNTKSLHEIALARRKLENEAISMAH